MNIAIIGAGNVGSGLGRRWAEGGHTVVYGVRDTDSDTARAALEATPSATAATPAEAAADAAVVVLAVPWTAARDAVVALGDLGGKPLIDATNPVGGTPPAEGSGAQAIAAWSTGAKVVKAFNNIGAAHYADPDFAGHAAAAVIVSDDADAKAVASDLAREIGFEVLDAGGLEHADEAEAMAKLWINLAYQQGLGPGIGWVLIRK